MTRKAHLKVVYDDDFYQGMRRRVRDWAESKGRGHKYLDIILLAPDLLHLMFKLSLDSRVPVWCKAKLGLAIAYFVSPIDLLPEAVLGPIGYLDDVAVAAWVLDDIIKSAGREVVLEHWAGEADIIEVVAKLVGGANEILGSGLVRRLGKAFDPQGLGPPMLSNGDGARRLSGDDSD